MAEALFARGIAEGVSVESAGLGALVGEPADPSATALMQELGIDISSHRARDLTPEMVRNADLILVMESVHRKAMHGRFPDTRGKVFRLGEWGKFDIDDPYDQPREFFKSTLELIQRGVEDWAERLKR